MTENERVLHMDAATIKRNNLLERIDELDRLEEHTTDPAVLKYIAERKKELRTAYDTL